ncbi:MAG: DedA family protein [Chloroflexi bacterium]|nr:MAG: DedA family protein [Chloroflexota bacterium]TMG31725.1 MAG: DedA family protein [Chloroflexota bacterium]
MTNLVAQYGYLAVLVIVGLESTGVPLPGETTLVAAALYAGATHNLNIVGVVIAAAVGAILGDNLGYLIGHWGGYRLLIRYGRYIRLSEKRIKIARYLFLRYGGEVVFFGRFTAILRAYAAFLAGTTRMPWRRFLFFNAAGGIAWATIYGGGAYLLGRQIERLSGPFEIVFVAAAVIAIVVGALIIRRQEERLAVAAEKAFPGPLHI